jgi:hypothetical protein
MPEAPKECAMTAHRSDPSEGCSKMNTLANEDPEQAGGMFKNEHPLSEAV